MKTWKITIKNDKHCFIIFDKTCLNNNNNLLPKYTLVGLVGLLGFMSYQPL